MALYGSILQGNNTFNCSLWTLNIEFIGSIFLLSYYYIAPTKNRVITIFSLLLLLHILFKENSIYYIAIVCGSLLINTSLNNIILKKLAILCFITLYFFVVIFDELMAYSLPTLFSWDPINVYGTIAALSLVLAIKSGFGSKILMSNTVQFLGKISYPLYMLHILILFSISCYLYDFLPKTNLYIFINFVIYIFLTLVFSSLFEKFIDKPAVDYSHAFGNWLLPVLILLLILIFIAYRLKIKLNKIEIVFIISGLFSMLVMFASPTYPSRATFGSLVFLLIPFITSVKYLLSVY